MSLIKILKKNINELIDIEDVELEIIASVFKSIKISSKKTILKKGNKVEYIAFVTKGCLVQYSKYQDKEFVIDFFEEGSWVGDIDSFLKGNSTNSYIKTLEETELMILNYDDFMSLIQTSQAFLQYHLLYTHKKLVQSVERLAKMNALAAEDKYMMIMQESSDIINRVPSKYLASYLGIEPPSLSRIRRNLSKKNL